MKKKVVGNIIYEGRVIQKVSYTLIEARLMEQHKANQESTTIAICKLKYRKPILPSSLLYSLKISITQFGTPFFILHTHNGVSTTQICTFPAPYAALDTAWRADARSDTIKHKNSKAVLCLSLSWAPVIHYSILLIFFPPCIA